MSTPNTSMAAGPLQNYYLVLLVFVKITRKLLKLEKDGTKLIVLLSIQVPNLATKMRPKISSLIWHNVLTHAPNLAYAKISKII